MLTHAYWQIVYYMVLFFNFSQAECSWLRLAAGCAMLKICEQKGVGDVYTLEQFYNLSQLVVDDVKEVREIFVAKLHKVVNQNNGFCTISVFMK